MNVPIAPVLVEIVRHQLAPNPKRARETPTTMPVMVAQHVGATVLASLTMNAMKLAHSLEHVRYGNVLMGTVEQILRFRNEPVHEVPPETPVGLGRRVARMVPVPSQEDTARRQAQGAGHAPIECAHLEVVLRQAEQKLPTTAHDQVETVRPAMPSTVQAGSKKFVARRNPVMKFAHPASKSSSLCEEAKYSAELRS